MIGHVYENIARAKTDLGLNCEVAVVTDNEKVESFCLESGYRVHRVDDPVESGTERIFLAWQRNYSNESFDFIINVQGDEPLIEKEDIKDLINFHQNSAFDIATVVQEKSNFDDFKNPNRVKAVYENETGKCHYFSRSPVPFDRDGGLLKKWHLHIGIYSYRAEALEAFCQAPVSPLENIEKLEQLRALGLGKSIGATLARHEFIGVDHPEDIAIVEGAMK